MAGVSADLPCGSSGHDPPTPPPYICPGCTTRHARCDEAVFHRWIEIRVMSIIVISAAVLCLATERINEYAALNYEYVNNPTTHTHTHTIVEYIDSFEVPVT